MIGSDSPESDDELELECERCCFVVGSLCKEIPVLSGSVNTTSKMTSTARSKFMVAIEPDCS